MSSDLLFQVLENEEDVIMKNGAPSETNQRLASQGMHSSKFCLDPAGYMPASCRLFDAILSIFHLCCEAGIFSFNAEKFHHRNDSGITERAEAVPVIPLKRYFDYKDPNGALNEGKSGITDLLSVDVCWLDSDKLGFRTGKIGEFYIGFFFGQS
ncbi:Putative glycosyltransferase [Fagus crenata]